MYSTRSKQWYWAQKTFLLIKHAYSFYNIALVLASKKTIISLSTKHIEENITKIVWIFEYVIEA
jgi:hypothetical protein